MKVFPEGGWFVGLRKLLINRITVLTFGLVLLTFVAAMVDDRLRQHEVAVAVHDLANLQPGKGELSEVLRVVRKNQLVGYREDDGRYQKQSCDDSNCYFGRVVEADPLIMWLTTHGSEFTGIKALWFERIGMRPWGVRFGVRVQRGRLTDTQVEFSTTQPYPQHPYEGWWWNSVSISYTDDLMNQLLDYDRNRGVTSRLLRNASYGAWTRKNVFVVVVTKGATSDELETALNFDLGCLSTHPCHGWGDVVPRSWKSFCSDPSRDSHLDAECARSQ